MANLGLIPADASMRDIPVTGVQVSITHRGLLSIAVEIIVRAVHTVCAASRSGWWYAVYSVDN